MEDFDEMETSRPSSSLASSSPAPSPPGTTLFGKARDAAGRRLLGGGAAATKKSSGQRMGRGSSQGVNALHRLYNQTRIQIDQELTSPSLDPFRQQSSSRQGHHGSWLGAVKPGIAPGTPAEKVFVIGEIIIGEHLEALSARDDFGKSRASSGSSLINGPCMEYLLRNDILFQLVEISARAFDCSAQNIVDDMETDEHEPDSLLRNRRLVNFPRLDHAPVLVSLKIAVCELIGRLIHRCGPHFLENAGVHRAMNLMIEVGTASHLDVSEGRIFINSPEGLGSPIVSRNIRQGPSSLHSRLNSALVEMMYEVTYAISQNSNLLPMLVRSETRRASGEYHGASDGAQINLNKAKAEKVTVFPLLSAQLQYITHPGRTGHLARESIENLVPFANDASPLGNLLTEEQIGVSDHDLEFANIIGAASGALYSALSRRVSPSESIRKRDASEEDEQATPSAHTYDNDEDYLIARQEFMEMLTFTDRMMACGSAINPILSAQVSKGFERGFVQNVLLPSLTESEAGETKVTLLAHLKIIAETLPEAESRSSAWSTLWKGLLSMTTDKGTDSSLRPLFLSGAVIDRSEAARSKKRPDSLDVYVADALSSSSPVEVFAALEFLAALLQHHPITSRLLFASTTHQSGDVITIERHLQDLDCYTSLAQSLLMHMAISNRRDNRSYDVTEAEGAISTACAKVLEHTGEDARMPLKVTIEKSDLVLKSLLQLTRDFLTLDTVVAIRLTSIWSLLFTNPLIDLGGWVVLPSLPVGRHYQHSHGTRGSCLPSITPPSHSRTKCAQRFDTVELLSSCQRICQETADAIEAGDLGPLLQDHAHGLLVNGCSLPTNVARTYDKAKVSSSHWQDRSPERQTRKAPSTPIPPSPSIMAASPATSESSSIFAMPLLALSPFSSLFGRAWSRESASDTLSDSARHQDRFATPVKLSFGTKLQSSPTRNYNHGVGADGKVSWIKHLLKLERRKLTFPLHGAIDRHQEVTLKTLLNNICILEEFMQEMIAIVQARRLTGIDYISL